MPTLPARPRRCEPSNVARAGDRVNPAETGKTIAMNRDPLHPISADEIRAYGEDGAVCVRGQFDRDWIERMLAVVEANLENPAGTVLASGDDEPGKVIANSHMARSDPAFMDFVRNSPAREIAAQPMGLDEIRFFHDRLFIDESGIRRP